jgi:hypothetical protein
MELDCAFGQPSGWLRLDLRKAQSGKHKMNQSAELVGSTGARADSELLARSTIPNPRNSFSSQLVSLSQRASQQADEMCADAG